VIIISITLAAFSKMNMPPSEVDTSWISTVEQLLKDAKPYPPNNSSLSPPGYPQHLNVYLQENGTSTLIYYDTSSELSDYLDQILQSVDLEKNHTVSELFLSKVMEKDRVVELSYNQTMLSNMADSTKRFYQGYFILQDNLDEGLTGAIIARQIPYVDSTLSLWVKTK
jgi:hypothetical protein